jgi:uncharacterized membrane protein
MNRVDLYRTLFDLRPIIEVSAQLPQYVSPMDWAHGLNLGVHVGAGVAGIGLGFSQLARRKGDARHARLGRWFLAAALVVTGSATIGLIFFRFLPMFAVLTVLATYVAVGGWRVARTRAGGPQFIDLCWTLAGCVTAAALVPVLINAPHSGDSQPVVVWSTLGGLGTVLAYDLLRWTFPRRWFERLWLPEHIYKVNSALFGMLSAFVGNVVRWGQPWSQIAPSVLGVLVILYWWWRSPSFSRATAR